MLHAPGNGLQELRDEIESQFARGDYREVLEQIKGNGPAVWYGFRPERILTILEVIIRSGSDSQGIAQQMQRFISGGHQPLPADELSPLADGLPVLSGPDPSHRADTAKLIALRLSGRSEAAIPILKKLHRQAVIVEPLFDTSGGWNLLISVQCGITAMLAGEFTLALTYFSAAQHHAIVPTLVFLNRDAYVKSAIIQAVFGDPEDARASLDHASQLPRTISWAEDIVDTHAALVEAILEPNAERAAEALLTIPLRDIGEMWPFLVIALRRILIRTGRIGDLNERISMIEQLAFPRMDGEGFAGSVLPTTRATISLARNDVKSAEWFIERSDDNYIGTRLTRAAIELASGRPQHAIRIVNSLGNATVGFTQLRLWRYALLASAYLDLERTAPALEALQTAMTVTGGIRPEHLQLFSEPVREFAEHHLTEWPTDKLQGTSTEPEAGAPAVWLTDREREILVRLARGATRADMAAELFISVNTLKSHLRMIYKKLDVSDRATAVLRAEREGWL